MTFCLPATLAITVVAALATAQAGAGSCAPEGSRNCFKSPAVINFNSVPEISKQIVSEEKPAQSPQKLTTDPPAPTPYTGPIVGTNPRPGRTPTVGYYWSFE